MIKAKCKKCGSSNLRVELEMFKNGSGPHRRCTCNDCGAFQKFISKKEVENIEITTNPVTLDDLNFKLDLILDNLGIIQHR